VAGYAFDVRGEDVNWRRPGEGVAIVVVRHALATLVAVIGVWFGPGLLVVLGLGDACGNCATEVTTGGYVAGGAVGVVLGVAFVWAALWLAADAPIRSRRTPVAVLLVALLGAGLTGAGLVIADAVSGPGLEGGTAVPIAIAVLVLWHVGLVIAAGWASSRRS
jgi:hypothetical protein